MKAILSILVLVSLCACDAPKESVPVQQAAYLTAPEDYVCTPEEMQRVQAEHMFCDKNTSFFSSYCYGTAIMRNCKRK